MSALGRRAQVEGRVPQALVGVLLGQDLHPPSGDPGEAALVELHLGPALPRTTRRGAPRGARCSRWTTPRPPSEKKPKWTRLPSPIASGASAGPRKRVTAASCSA